MSDIKVYDEDGEHEYSLRDKAGKLSHDELIEEYVKEGISAYGGGAYIDTCRAAAFMMLYMDNGTEPSSAEVDEQIQSWWELA